MKVAICDDEKFHRDYIQKMLAEYRTPDGQRIGIDIFNNAIELISAMKQNNYNALFLDVIMPAFSGLDAARDIRLDNSGIPIVFLTSSPEFAVESYRVRAFDYLMKPVNSGDLFKTLDRIFALTKTQVKEYLTITHSKGSFVLPYDQLEFVEINNRVLSFHTVDGEIQSIAGRLSDYEKMILDIPQFIKVHRSYIINMSNMKSFNKSSFTTVTGEVIPVSRNIAREVQDKYLNYLKMVIHK